MKNSLFSVFWQNFSQVISATPRQSWCNEQKIEEQNIYRTEHNFSTYWNLKLCLGVTFYNTDFSTAISMSLFAILFQTTIYCIFREKFSNHCSKNMSAKYLWRSPLVIYVTRYICYLWIQQCVIFFRKCTTFSAICVPLQIRTVLK